MEVGADGRILRVGPSRSHAAGATDAASAGSSLVDLGDAILLPGLVNVHAHPELTVLRGSLEALPFDAWIGRIIHLKYEVLEAGELAASTRWGIAEAARGGVSSVGMIDDAGYGPEALAASGLRGVCYVELFGPDPKDADAALQSLHERLATARGRFAATEAAASGRVRLGVSPHSPFTVSAPLMERALDLAADDGMPVSIHAAESAAETEFVRRGRGPLAERLATRGIELTASGRSPVEWLADRNALGPHVLLAHCIHASESDIDLIADRGAAVAHCPVSNAKLGHGIAPLAIFRQRGVRVGIGSDSVATNNRVDMFAEARTGALLQAASSRDAGRTDPEPWFRLITLGGAEALGLDAETGSLEPGKWADLAVVSLAASHMVPSPDPYAALLFAATAADVVLTVVGGVTVFGREAGPALFSESDRTVLQNAARRFSG